MDRYEHVEHLMEAFAERTGLVGQRAPRRYLWTDAYAVCNYLELYRALGNDQFLDRATRLVAQVHDVLGAYAANDSRRGWLGGMDDSQHRLTLTRAGLRIGKSLPERSPGEPLDEQREWDRDGQYFHYLTRWTAGLRPKPWPLPRTETTANSGSCAHWFPSTGTCFLSAIWPPPTH